ncbi:MAG: type III-B CRISPR module RAMP protein Cmr6, partial [Zetaproteobacteria bacterium]
MRAAVPSYMRDMEQAPPGHRFTLYFAGWDENWSLADTQKRETLSGIQLRLDDLRCRDALIERQRAQGERIGGALFSIVAQSTAPFVTGLGYEHPLENGFAFLNPYGLPYLPGSSVKGVLRKAAEELVLGGEAQGFDMLDVWRLFGFDGNAAFLNEVERIQNVLADQARLEKWLKKVLPKAFKQKGLDDPQAFLTSLPKNNALRRSLFNMGALSFWDVFPQGKLTIEIMTPHHANYLQKGGTPHDSEKPNPIPFLAVAPGAKFHFFVQQIGDIGDCDWRDVLIQCFQHAFDWLGFGAKTSVGYGAMREDPRERERRLAEEERRRQEEKERRLREEQERKRREEEERRRREFEALPEHERVLVQA